MEAKLSQMLSCVSTVLTSKRQDALIWLNWMLNKLDKVMSKVSCPYCGSSKTHRTAYGWGESIVKNTATYGVGGAIALVTHAIPYIGKGAAHSVIHKTEEISESNSCEYECDYCHKTFKYSSGKG